MKLSLARKYAIVHSILDNKASNEFLGQFSTSEIKIIKKEYDIIPDSISKKISKLDHKDIRSLLKSISSINTLESEVSFQKMIEPEVCVTEATKALLSKIQTASI